MDEDGGKTAGAEGFRLPVAMTEHAAAVSVVDGDDLRRDGNLKRWTGQKIADNGLEVAVGEPAMGLEGGEPGRELGEMPWVAGVLRESGKLNKLRTGREPCGPWRSERLKAAELGTSIHLYQVRGYTAERKAPGSS
jgi:hypothetical protein